MGMKRRRPWVAFILTQFCPGLGQLYNGDLRWVIYSFALSFGLALFSVIYLFDSLAKLLIAITLALLVDLWLSIQAFLAAKRIGAVELKWYQRWWARSLFVVLVYGVPDFYGLVLPSRIRSFQIPSESMVPNLLVGDRLIADGWSYWWNGPKRGDVIVFDYPRDPSIKYVKRLIGLPGDKVEVKAGELFLNGALVPRRRAVGDGKILGSSHNAIEYVENLEGLDHTLYRALPENVDSFGPVTVPPNKYFMMGDNRDHSSDSRVWGFVDREQIIGRMNYVYFPWDQEAYDFVREDNPADLLAAIRAGIRSDRFGKKVN